jgi:hypothetical protein
MKNKKIKLPLEILEIKGDGYHLFTEIHIADKPLRVVVDTGASRTVIDKGWVSEHQADLQLEENELKAAGLGSNQISNYIMVIPELKLGACTLNEYVCAALDLSGINENYLSIDAPIIDGILGSDLLFKLKAEINYGKAEMLLTV